MHAKKCGMKCIITISIFTVVGVLCFIYTLFAINNLADGNLFKILLHKVSIQYLLATVIFVLSIIVIVNMLIKFFVLREREKLSYNDNDVMTNFYGRNKFELDMMNFFKRKEKVIVIVMDLDNLKKINDTYGHSVGDIAIKTFCSTISQICKNMLRYRSGGDEFVLIISENEYTAKYCIERIKEISKEETMKINYKGEKIPVEFSFGVASTLKDGENVKRLYDIADSRMYMMKNKKKRDNDYKRMEM